MFVSNGEITVTAKWEISVCKYFLGIFMLQLKTS